jgi:tRNA(fMet)-specific endonuclease VapC
VIKYLLDTNICIYIIRKKPIGVIEKLQSLEISEVGISSITLSELEFGVEKSGNPLKNKLALIKFLAPIDILDFDDHAAQHYGKIRAFLESKGTPIGPLDTLIAAHALAIGCVLVTNNTKEFERVNNLPIEDWV